MGGSVGGIPAVTEHRKFFRTDSSAVVKPFSTAKLNCYVGKVISININTNRIEVQFDYEDLN